MLINLLSITASLTLTRYLVKFYIYLGNNSDAEKLLGVYVYSAGCILNVYHQGNSWGLLLVSLPWTICLCDFPTDPTIPLSWADVNISMQIPATNKPVLLISLLIRWFTASVGRYDNLLTNRLLWWRLYWGSYPFNIAGCIKSTVGDFVNEGAALTCDQICHQFYLLLSFVSHWISWKQL